MDITTEEVSEEVIKQRREAHEKELEQLRAALKEKKAAAKSERVHGKAARDALLADEEQKVDNIQVLIYKYRKMGKTERIQANILVQIVAAAGTVKQHE
jgi:hypothetical protein